MTGLNLEPFLRLLQADVGAWATLGAAALLVALIAWTGWGSRRALRKCIVLSVLAHLGLAFFKGDEISRLIAPGVPDGRPSDGAGIRAIRVAPAASIAGGVAAADGRGRPGTDGGAGSLAPDLNLAALAFAVPIEPRALGGERPEPSWSEVPIAGGFDRPDAPTLAGLEPTPEPPIPPVLDERPPGIEPEPGPDPIATPEPSEFDPAEVATVIREDRPSETRSVAALPEPGRLAARPSPRGEAEAFGPSPRPEVAPPLPDLPEPDPGIAPTGDREPDRMEPAPAEASAASPEEAEVADAGPRRSPEAPPSRPAFPEEPGRRGFRPVPGPPIEGGPSRPRRDPASIPLPDGPGAPPGPSARAVAEEGPPEADRPGPGPARPSASDPEAVEGPDRRPAARRIEPEPLELPEADLRVAARPAPEAAPVRVAERAAGTPGPDLGGVVPGAPALPALADLRGGAGGRTLQDVPEVYRPRLDPNRSELARRAGASAASEEAVERALGWLARHQDADGRWDAGTARYRDGSPAPGDDSFTAHCPPGDICHGECFYWEADTAVTGLALLAFLGSGYTHTDGPYAAAVGRGIDFLIRAQRPDGDLRGPSRAVGMYCHAMATLALSEAYALSGDAKLREPVERAVSFLADAQYPALLGWRYLPRSEIRRTPAEGGRGWEYDPHPPVGDTSVLGWVVMVLKSASEVGVEVPSTAAQAAGNWLRRVADGDAGGLARYQPSRPADPVMTAEAWVCRQFLGVGGPGAASDEAAAYLLEHPPSADSFNVYYWYYATLAMYQNGGPAWERWNATIRDTLVGLQHRDGHKAGSWDPDPTRYGTHGGRVYATALSAMTLEVYYRYLRLYASEGGVAIGPGRAPPPALPGDDDLRRAVGGPPR